MTRVEYLDAEPNGLAAMLGGLIEGNLAQHPERRRLLRPSLVGIVAADAGVGVTLRLAPGRVTVANGLVGRPPVVVRADSDTLTELAGAPLRFGFPDVLTEAGRALARKVLTRELRVRGLLARAPEVARLNRLLSVV